MRLLINVYVKENYSEKSFMMLMIVLYYPADKPTSLV